MINSVILAGNLTRDPEIRRTQSGMPIVSFSLAVNERAKNRQTGEWEDRPNFFDVSAFGERWEKLANYMHKGTKVTVQGRLRQSSWEKDGQRRSKVDVVAMEIELPPKQGGQSQRQGEPEYVESTYIDGGSSVYDDDIPFF